MAYDASLDVRKEAAAIIYPTDQQRANADTQLLSNCKEALGYMSRELVRPLLAPAASTTKLFDTPYDAVLRIPDILASPLPTVSAYATVLTAGTHFLWLLNDEQIGYNGLIRLVAGEQVLWNDDRTGLPYARISISGYWGIGNPLPPNLVSAAARVAVKLHRKENRQHADRGGNEQTGYNTFAANLFDDETWNLIRPYRNRYRPQVVAGPAPTE